MPDNFPDDFRADFIECNGATLRVIHNGRSSFSGSKIDDDRIPLMCLHGFPEFWICWEAVMALMKDDYFIVVPDQRGCGRSDMPADPALYSANHLVGDIVSLAQKVFGRRKFHLAGHDFGASVAYALAFSFPQVIETLTVVNGAHPVCLQEALIDNPAQAEASQYFHTVREEGSGSRAAANNFDQALRDVAEHSRHFWIDDKMQNRLRSGWESAARLDAMFNWYRASPIVVPSQGQERPQAPLYGAQRDAFRVPMPHLLIWGVDDTALLPDVRRPLPDFCDDLTIEEVEDADHWILHTKPERVAALMRKFLEA